MSLENRPSALALATLATVLVEQGHPRAYAEHMAAATIFQADLDLRNAQLVRLLGWLQQEHAELYPQALTLLDATRDEFEERVRRG